MPTLEADNKFWDPLPGIFDFTLKFEETMMEIAPSGINLALLSVFVDRFRHVPVYVRSSALLGAKMFFCVTLVACQAACVGLRYYATGDQTSTAMAAASIDLIAAVSLTFMIYVGHKHSIHSSTPLAIYLFCTMLFDIVRSRSFFLRPDMPALGGLASATAFLRFCMLVLEERSKVHLILDDEIRNISGPEAASGYFRRAFFLFLNPIFMLGYFGTLRREDMGQLGLDFSSKLLHQRFKSHWNRQRRGTSQLRLLTACFLTWKWEIALLAVPRLINTGLALAQPFLIQDIINTVAADQSLLNDDITDGKRAGMQCATFFIFLGLAISKTASMHLSNRLATQVRGGLVTELMEKTHRLREQEAKKSAVLTHMSSDIEEVAQGLTNFVDIPLSLFEVTAGILVLSRFIGQSCFFALVPVITCNLVAYLVGSGSGPALANWNKAIQDRVATTTEVLKQLMGIKMMGLGPVVRDKIHEQRVKEMNVSKIYRYYMAVMNVTQQFADIGTPVTVIAASFFWKGFGGEMTSGKVFPTLAVLNLVQTPTLKALYTYSVIAGMTSCFERIQAFLLLPERKDSRVKWDPSAPRRSFEPVASSSSQTVTRPEPPAQSPGGIIQFHNASIGPVEMAESLLTGINLALTRGSVSAVVGHTGCGKTTFFKSIMGETKNRSGFVYTDKVDIAFCGSTVWLRDASIRDNVVGCLPYDPVRYRLAITACQLQDDLGRLPGGDDYGVGPNGQNLSGGQRQRVALARAVFANCAITIIDDGLSSLDEATAIAVLYGLCGHDGALRISGTTVLLSTYLPEVLNVVDQTITIDEHAQITLASVHANDPSRNQRIANFLKSVKREVHAEDNEKEEEKIRRQWTFDPQRPLDADEDIDNREGNWRFYLLFIDSIGRWNAFGFGLLAIAMAASEFLPEIYIRVWVEKGPKDGKYFIGYALVVTAVCMLTAVTYYVLYVVVAVQAAVALHKQLIDVSMRASIGFITSIKTGDLLNRFSQDCSLFSKTLPSVLFRTVYFCSLTTISVGIILSSTTYMSSILPVIVLSVYSIQKFYLRTSRQMRHIDLQEKAPLYTYFSETADGLVHVQAFGWQAKNMSDGYTLLDNSQQPFYLMLCIQQWLGLVLGILTTVVAFTMVSVVVWVRKGTSASAVGLSFLSIIGFQRTFTMLLEAWTASETSVASLSRLFYLKKNTPQEPHAGQSPPFPEDWPSAGLDFEDVSAKYSADEEVPPIIRDFSLEIEQGDKVGLVGRTGSGKSSLLLTALGFLDYTGTVEVGGLDIEGIDPDVLRSRVITITQDPVQFSDTVRKNLLPFTMNDKPPLEIDEEQRMRMAELDAMLRQVLESLNLWTPLSTRGGLDAMLPEVGYSKGELQLFSIARAIVRRRETGNSIILVDEATSNLDPKRDADTQKVMQSAFEGCTMLTIAHRTAAISDVYYTVVMKNGEMETMKPGAQGVPREETPNVGVLHGAGPSIRTLNMGMPDLTNQPGPSSQQAVAAAIAQMTPAQARTYQIRVDWALSHGVKPPPPP